MKAFINVPMGAAGSDFVVEKTVRYLEGVCETAYNKLDRVMTAEEVAEVIGDADAYVTGWGSTALTKTILDAAPNLKLLVHLGGSVFDYVTPEMWDRGIRVVSGNDIMAESVAEATLCYTLAAYRDLPRICNEMKTKGSWRTYHPLGWMNRGLRGKTVGVISYGAVAKHFVRMLQPFAVNIRVYDIKSVPEEDKAKYGITQVSLEEIFKDSDIVSLHTPLNDKTYRMIGKEHFAMMKDRALFVNTARGAVIDEEALIEELKTGRICAALDVYDTEPLDKESPLRGLPNTLLMPHMAGPTYDLRSYTTEALLTEAAAYVDRGEELRSEISRQMAEGMTRSASKIVKS